MSKKKSQVELLSELSSLERQGVILAAAWKTTAAAAAAGDVSKASDVMVLYDLTDETIQAAKRLVVKMARSGFEAEDDGFGQCLALLFAAAEMSVHFAEAVDAARRVVELQREVSAMAVH
jgi:hypothetical protein